MTVGRTFRYLDREDFRNIHTLLTEWAKKDGEPVPSFGFAKEGELEALIAAPKRTIGGQDAYPTLEEKAAIIFYTINKSQIFMNGNKRMSTLALVVFLVTNGKMLNVSPDALTAKALWLANTEAQDFPLVKTELAEWIRKHLTVDLGENSTGL